MAGGDITKNSEHPVRVKANLGTHVCRSLYNWALCAFLLLSPPVPFFVYYYINNYYTYPPLGALRFLIYAHSPFITYIYI